MRSLAELDNPIYWQESLFQERNISGLTRRLWTIYPIGLVLLIAIIAHTLTDYTAPTRDLAFYGIWFVHAMVVVRAIVAGANTISREHVAVTWDSLVLTGVSARMIFIGKWRAALAHSAPWMFALGVVRLAMLPVFVLAMINRFAFISRGYIYTGDSQGYTLTLQPWTVVAAVVMCVALTILEVMSATVLGMAASAIARQGWQATIAAIAIRFIPVAVTAGLLHYAVGVGPNYRMFRFPFFAIADSGTAPIAQLILPRFPWWNDTFYLNATYGLILATLVILILLLGGALIAWYMIRRTGALPYIPNAAPLHITPHLPTPHPLSEWR
jgi:hypothetical protein